MTTRVGAIEVDDKKISLSEVEPFHWPGAAWDVLQPRNYAVRQAYVELRAREGIENALPEVRAWDELVRSVRFESPVRMRFYVGKLCSCALPWCPNQGRWAMTAVGRVKPVDRDPPQCHYADGTAEISATMALPDLGGDQRKMLEWIRRAVLSFLMHEVDENFEVSGTRPFDPHTGDGGPDYGVNDPSA